ncbi:MAG TPA: RAMP superfamily CRISPR-associated protein [Gemmatimonadaceae bacterium]|nr:RAMP superfamily CRISPR-associated protein [Gemmatimonadaceae bacterium]
MTGSYEQFMVVGMAIDPIHVGTGGARLGRVDLSIVRDPVTRVPKIPGSSLAGVCRTYAAMRFEEQRNSRQQQQTGQSSRTKPYFPDCAGQGQPDQTGRGGHCGRADCPICTVFGFAKGAGGGFAGLAAFSDAHVLLFPVATREGPVWVTCPDALRKAGDEIKDELDDAVYQKSGKTTPLNLGWLLLERKNSLPKNAEWPKLNKLDSYITGRLAIVSDKLFSHIVNSNLDVRTSVSINPETGAAEEGALFSYEALPRATVLVWDVVCKNPQHFQVGGQKVSAQVNGQEIDASAKVIEVVKFAHPYLEHLGIGGMGTRGMGRMRVLSCEPAATSQQAQAAPADQDQASSKTAQEAS